MRASKIFRNTLLFAASTASMASASNAQGVAQGDATISNCQVGQTTGPDQACHNVVRTIEVSPSDVEAINRLLAEKGGRLATPDEVAAAWENLGLDTSAFYKMSDGRFAVPSQNGVGAVFQRGVNFRDSGVATFAKGVFYVDAQAPRPSSVAQVQTVVQGDVSITPHNYDCGEGKFDAQPNSAEIKCTPQVYFHETYLPPESAQRDAMNMARERAWALATVDEIQTAFNSLNLNVPKTGLIEGGALATPVQQDTPYLGVSRGINLNTRVIQPEGFFYVLESAAGRVQPLPVTFEAPDWWPPIVRVQPSGGMLNSSWMSVPRPNYAELWSNALSDQHPAKALFGLGDAVLLRSAARRLLSKQGKATTAAAQDQLLDSLRSDPVARYEFVPHLLGEAFEALETANPDPGQRRFREIFELYMSYEKYRVNGIAYTRWRDFNGTSPFTPQQGAGYAAPAANFLPKFPSVDQFMAQHSNPMEIPSSGLDAIALLISPSATAGLPDFKNDDYTNLGQDLNSVAAAVGIGTTVATAAGTLAITSAAVFGPAVTLHLSSAAAAALGLSTANAVAGIVHVTATPAVLLAKNTLMFGSATTLSGGATAGAIIAVALAALIGKTAAELAKSNEFDARLRRNLDDGPLPVDINSLLNSTSTIDRQTHRNAAFAYLMKMLVADPASKGLLTIEQPKVVEAEVASSLPEGEFSPVPGFVRLQNNWYKTSYVHNEGSKLAIGQVQPNWWSAMWKKVPTIGEWFVLQNRYRPNEYLHIQNGPLELGPIPGGEPWWSAQWREVPANDGWVRIQNRWKGDHYLNNSAGKIEAIPVQVNWASALWKVK